MYRITINGKMQNLKAWCRELNLNYDTVHKRVKVYKWPVLQALRLESTSSIIDKILNKVEYNFETHCWEWTKGLNSNGYAQMSINNKKESVHRIMYTYIYGDIPEDKPYILHRCDNRKCCNPMHLYAGTPQNNMDDRSKRNLSAKGGKHWKAKLTEKQVLEIRVSEEPQSVLAKRLNVGATTISNIKTMKTWKHI